MRIKREMLSSPGRKGTKETPLIQHSRSRRRAPQKYLGVLPDKKLTFMGHTEEIQRRTFAALNINGKIKNILQWNFQWTLKIFTDS